ncbi:MAG: helix-turn-helix domain-containing protein [Salinigranum sp.]
MLLTQNRTAVPDRDVLALLGSTAASAIVETLDRPMTVKEVSHASGVPLSTAYREVNRLTDADLLEESIRLDPVRGKHVTEYVRGFDTIEVSVTDDGIGVRIIS